MERRGCLFCRHSTIATSKYLWAANPFRRLSGFSRGEHFIFGAQAHRYQETCPVENSLGSRNCLKTLWRQLCAVSNIDRTFSLLNAKHLIPIKEGVEVAGWVQMSAQLFVQVSDTTQETS